ncbi:hypothetical protein MSIBF_A3150010 [groundwater metagenome]|uniref:Uncharacterized protein n=1 Tax=groundwater metagenome TaxID=717931 RepID=A0A098EDF5_9ZZZZ
MTQVLRFEKFTHIQISFLAFYKDKDAAKFNLPFLNHNFQISEI